MLRASVGPRRRGPRERGSGLPRPQTHAGDWARQPLAIYSTFGVCRGRDILPAPTPLPSSHGKFCAPVRGARERNPSRGLSAETGVFRRQRLSPGQCHRKLFQEDLSKCLRPPCVVVWGFASYFEHCNSFHEPHGRSWPLPQLVLCFLSVTFVGRQPHF